MVIVICDDDEIEAQKVEQLCKEICGREDTIYTYTDSLELYQWLMQVNWEVDLFVLDIEMPQLNGIELKRQISKMSIDTHIVFLTNHRESIDEAFGRYVIGFVDKGNCEKRLRDIVIEVKDEVSKEDVVNILEAGEICSFRQKEIIKIEAQHIYTKVEMIQYYNQDKNQWVTDSSEHRISLKEWEQNLNSEDFYRINRSMIVNFRYVKRINNLNELEFINGERYDIPVKKRKTVRMAYNQYCMRKARCM